MSFWSGSPELPRLKPTFLRFSRRSGGGGGGLTLPFFGSEIMNLLGFFFFSILSRKSVSEFQLHGVCMGRSGTSAHALYAFFSHFCLVGGSGAFGDPVVPTLRGVSGDVVTVYAYEDAKGRFLQSLVLLRAGHNLCQKCETTISTNNSSHE